MKKFFILVFVLLFVFPAISYSSEKKVIYEILDILKEKKIITEKKYNELKSRIKTEERETYERIRKEIIAKEKTDKKVEIGYKDGFYIKTKDNNFKIKLGGRVNFDGKFFINNDHPKKNDLFLRRARIGVSGTFYRHYDFKVETDFAKSGASLKDGYLNFGFFPEYQLKVGQFKVPFSLESVSSSLWMDFIERSIIASNLTPGRDYGIMLHGNPFAGKLHYGIGIFDGTRANKSDNDDDKDVALRIALSPFKDSGNILLKNLYIGGSMTYGHHRFFYPSDKDYLWNKGSFRTYGGTKFFEFSDDIKQKGKMARYGEEFFWAVGPLSLQGEWLKMDFGNMINSFGKVHNLSIKGGYLNIGYFITGERRILKNGKLSRIRPKYSFIPHKKKAWGAIELALRYDYMKFDDDFFKYGFSDASIYTDRVEGFTLGINWFLNPVTLVRLNYSHVDFDDYVKEADDNKEDVILGRFQIVW